MITEVSGACRPEELYNVTIKEFEDREAFTIVKITNSNTHIQRLFTIKNKEDEKIHDLEFFHKYIKFEPHHEKSPYLF